ncbi:hypothetical protein D9757_010728 [Collybiopsis confluens]|uniref:Uncharacterized protein n=1 Tax=Collybiopsis confluens TaxID=2823264 RepID=A0A8H5GZT8_9AGAR|nr:hypothetical protein D9757_010728 [Collybiopsis confluens]
MQIRLQKFIILSLFLASPACASSGSWFGSNSESTPSAYPSSFSSWTPSQYSSFQQTFASVRDSTFDAWDESRLREWLLEQGIVAPSGPREELVLMAKRRWRDWQDASVKYSASASSTIDKYASSASSTVSEASSVVSSYAAQATANVLPYRPFDTAKDYVWSTWDDTQLRKYLVDKNIIDNRTAAGKKRDQLIELAKEHYVSAKGKTYETWSDSYMYEWLAAHSLIDTRNKTQKTRDEYAELMGKYYYDTKENVWETWTDSELRAWLIDNGYMKSDAAASRDAMLKSVRDNYYSAQSTLTSAWSESQMREWLIEHGYLRSDAQVKKDEIVSLFQQKYASASSTISAYTAPYLTWPDARLRAYLRESGISDSNLPTSRPSLLQEVRIRWVQTSSSAERMLNRLKDVLDSNVVGPVEDQLAKVWEVLKGSSGDAKEYAGEKYEDSQAAFEDKKERAYEKTIERLPIIVFLTGTLYTLKPIFEHLLTNMDPELSLTIEKASTTIGDSQQIRDWHKSGKNPVSSTTSFESEFIIKLLALSDAI